MRREDFLVAFTLACAATAPVFASFPNGDSRLPWKFKGERLIYRSCGCADACWVAEVKDAKKSKVKARLRCDCTKLFYSLGGATEESVLESSCDSVNNPAKFKIIPKIMLKILGRSQAPATAPKG